MIKSHDKHALHKNTSNDSTGRRVLLCWRTLGHALTRPAHSYLMGPFCWLHLVIGTVTVRLTPTSVRVPFDRSSSSGGTAWASKEQTSISTQLSTQNVTCPSCNHYQSTEVTVHFDQLIPRLVVLCQLIGLRVSTCMTLWFATAVQGHVH